MNIRTSILGALAMLTLTCCCAAPESDSDMETTAASDTNEVVAETCAPGPMAPLVAAPEDIGGFVAAMLPPFDVDTACEAVTARFYLNDDLAPCEPPDAIDIVLGATDVNNPGPLSTDHKAVLLSPKNMWVETEDPNIYEVSWPIHTSYGPGESPVVGVTVQAHLCPITRPICSGYSAIRYRVSGGISALTIGLHFGLGDCHQTSP